MFFAWKSRVLSNCKYPVKIYIFSIGLQKIMNQDIKQRTILIADDEPDILEILHFNLVGQGYQVIKAINGDEAVDMAKIHNPDLVILDVMMPGKTGFEVCKILRS